MLTKLHARNGQSTLEYAVLIGVIVAGLVGMQVYIKRGFQGKLKESADSMGSQFSPGETVSNYTTKSGTSSSESTTTAGSSTTLITSQTNNRTGQEQVSGFNAENRWGNWTP